MNSGKNFKKIVCWYYLTYSLLHSDWWRCSIVQFTYCTVYIITVVPIVHRLAGRANFLLQKLNCVLPLISGKYLQGIFVAGWEPWHSQKNRLTKLTASFKIIINLLYLNLSFKYILNFWWYFILAKHIIIIIFLIKWFFLPCPMNTSPCHVTWSCQS